MSNSTNVKASDPSVVITVGNFIDTKADLIVDKSTLRGAWINQPEDGEHIPYEAPISPWAAAGPSPVGVKGSIHFSFGSADPKTLEFSNDGNQPSASFDGNPAPYEGDWDGQRVTLRPSTLPDDSFALVLWIGNDQPQGG